MKNWRQKKKGGLPSEEILYYTGLICGLMTQQKEERLLRAVFYASASGTGAAVADFDGFFKTQTRKSRECAEERL